MAFVRGMDMMLYINTGTEEVPVYTKVAGQRSATLNRSSETIETTNKDSGGYKTFETSFKEWSVDTDGLLIFDDASYNALETAYLNNSKIHVQLKTDAGEIYEGDSIITDFPIELPYDDLVTFSISLTGSGALDRTQAPTV